MKSYLTNMLVACVASLPLSAMAQSVKLADWNFESSDDVAATWFKDGAPTYAPDECVGESANYVMTALSTGRYWQLCTGYQNKVLRIENAEANDISDYTDASKHNVYYEVQFPTTGYKNISVDFACAYGANDEATLEAVVSTDGGNTWFDAGAYKTAPTWWTYNKNSVSLSANNKEKVILRLIAGNGFKSNWNLDYLTINGEVAEGGISADEKDFTLSWPLGKGTDDTTAAEVSKPGLFSVAEFDYGTLTVSTQRSVAESHQTLYKPANNNAAVNDDDALSFTIIPKKGITFTPKSFSFNAARWGTNGGAFDVVAITNGTETTLATGINPNRGNDGEFMACHYDLSGITVGSDGLILKIKVYKLASNKEYGFGEVLVVGDVVGTVESVPSYTLSLKSNIEGAGSLSSNPVGSEFDEGTSITVSATENFGYHFQEWTDAEGNTITTENPYSFAISENTSLIAYYTKNNVYALNLKLEGGANPNLVQFQPEGNIVEGTHYYEEGTDVKLSAINNKILTFTSWEGDAQGTDSEADLKMDGEKNVTAHFSAADYIVGWDLYNDQPNSQRAADYKSDSENAGLLSLRNAAGNTTSWLTRGVNNGAENGRWGARVWKVLTDGYYFEISFSTKGYTNVKVSNGLCITYNSWSKYNVEYSIDGENYTNIGTFNLQSGWTDGEFSLPAEANEQNRVYVRWMGDTTSEKVGNASDYDGLCIGDIFVTADAGAIADEVATLVSSTPEQNGTDVSANGSIILTYDNKIKAGSGNATLNGEEISPVISGKSAIFKYSGLKYATNYTFSMPEGVLLSRSGKPVAATEINFTTMERLQPEPRLYDAVVAQDGTGDHTTLQAAIDAAPAGRAKPWLIFVKNGRYHEHIDIPSTKPYLHIIGQDRDKAVIYDDRLCGGDNAYSVDPGATVVVKGANTFFENITLENSYGHEKQAGPQALALNTVADRVALNNVALLSYQDTWITTSTSNNRHYIKNSLIEGAVDFIYNSGNVYLDGDTIEINRPSGGYIVAPSHAADVKWGYVFMNNIIRPRKGITVTDVWLGRPWHNQPKTVFINTQTFVNIPAAGWYPTMGGLPAIWADYNTVDADGNPIDLSQRRDTYYYTDYYYKTTDESVQISTSDYNKLSATEKAEYTAHLVYGTAKNHLTAEEAAQYTLKNVMGGDDNWQPDLLCEACDAPQVTINSDGNKIEWEAVPYAICYVITCDGQVIGFTTDTSYDYSSTATYQVQAVNEYGGLSKKATAGVLTSINQLDANHNSPLSGELEGSSSAIITLDGRRTTTLHPGINIIHHQSTNKKTITKKIIF